MYKTQYLKYGFALFVCNTEWRSKFFLPCLRGFKTDLTIHLPSSNNSVVQLGKALILNSHVPFLKGHLTDYKNTMEGLHLKLLMASVNVFKDEKINQILYNTPVLSMDSFVKIVIFPTNHKDPARKDIHKKCKGLRVHSIRAYVFMRTSI